MSIFLRSSVYLSSLKAGSGSDWWTVAGGLHAFEASNSPAMNGDLLLRSCGLEAKCGSILSILRSCLRHGSRTSVYQLQCHCWFSVRPLDTVKRGALPMVKLVGFHSRPRTPIHPSVYARVRGPASKTSTSRSRPAALLELKTCVLQLYVPDALHIPDQTKS